MILKGTGNVYRNGELVFRTSYNLTETTSHTGVLSVEGVLQLPEGESGLSQAPKVLTLEIQDGRSMEFIVANYKFNASGNGIAERLHIKSTGSWLHSTA